MKILIMVLSFTDEPYLSLMKAQQETWDSVEVGGVRTVYYYGGGKGWVNEKEYSADTDDLYYRMHWKFALALKEVWDWDWQILVRINSSGYLCKERLIEFVKDLPIEKLYCGYGSPDINDGGDLCISGAAILMSRDCAEILLYKLDGEMNCEEDVLIGRVLRKDGIIPLDDKSRFDIPCEFVSIPKDRYHYRLKCGGPREVDISNMKKLHTILNI